MRYLLKAIKTKIATAAPTLANRISMAVLGEKIKFTDTISPYCKVVFVGQDDTNYAFADTVGYDMTVIQFSVFAESLTAADALIDQLLTGFNGVKLTLDHGNATGTKLKRGILIEPKSADANQVYHCWITFNFCHEDSLA